jgi:hypothetical protein
MGKFFISPSRHPGPKRRPFEPNIGSHPAFLQEGSEELPPTTISGLSHNRHEEVKKAKKVRALTPSPKPMMTIPSQNLTTATLVP